MESIAAIMPKPLDVDMLSTTLKLWYYADKAFGWAIDEDEFVEDLAKHIASRVTAPVERVCKCGNKFGQRMVVCMECGGKIKIEGEG